MNNLLSQAISNIKVAYVNKHDYAFVPRSNLILSCLDRLYKLGYINQFKLVSNYKVVVFLKYHNQGPVVRDLKLVSKQSRRQFYKVIHLRNRIGTNYQGFLLLSTDSGIMTDQECIFENKGGEPLFWVY